MRYYTNDHWNRDMSIAEREEALKWAVRTDRKPWGTPEDDLILATDGEIEKYAKRAGRSADDYIDYSETLFIDKR